MRSIALLAAFSLLAVLAPAEAHYAECHIENLTCVRACETGHLTTPAPHGCSYYGRALVGVVLP